MVKMEKNTTPEQDKKDYEDAKKAIASIDWRDESIRVPWPNVAALKRRKSKKEK